MMRALIESEGSSGVIDVPGSGEEGRGAPSVNRRLGRNKGHRPWELTKKRCICQPGFCKNAMTEQETGGWRRKISLSRKKGGCGRTGDCYFEVEIAQGTNGKCRRSRRTK